MIRGILLGAMKMTLKKNWLIEQCILTDIHFVVISVLYRVVSLAKTYMHTILMDWMYGREY